VKQKLLYDPFVIGIFCAEAEVLSFVQGQAILVPFSNSSTKGLSIF
jgi:hypothetical protein